MNLGTKLAALACVSFTAAGLLIKLYFIPSADRYLEDSVRHEMIRDTQALERIILIVVASAGNNRDTVRRALDAISRDPGIPVELRRSRFIERQYGHIPVKAARDSWEEAAMAGGQGAFRSTDTTLQYAYPLRARAICGNCHETATGQRVPVGTVLGLAVKTVPKSVLRESSLVFFVMDLFWQNLVMVGFLIAVLVALIGIWVVRPVNRLAARAEEMLVAGEAEVPPGRTELETIERGLDLASPRDPQAPS